MPDVPLAFFMGLSVYLFLKSEKSGNKKIFNFSKGNVYYILAGFTLGLGYLVKCLSLILFVFYLTYALFILISKKKVNPQYGLIIFGFLIIFASESIFYYFQTGDFLQRYHQLAGTYSVTKNYWGKGISFEDVLTFYPPALLNYSTHTSPLHHIFGYFYYFVLISMFYLIVKRTRDAYVLIIWAISLFLYLQIGTRSISQYLLMGKEIRFLTTITMPSLLMLAYFLTINQRIVKNVVLPITLSILLLTSIQSITRTADWFNYGMGACGCMRMSDIRQIHNFIKAQPKKCIC